MLVLSRQKNEEIQIGSDIKVKILKVGTSVKLGIEAPISLPVHRTELLSMNSDLSTSTGLEFRGAVT